MLHTVQQVLLDSGRPTINNLPLELFIRLYAAADKQHKFGASWYLHCMSGPAALQCFQELSCSLLLLNKPGTYLILSLHVQMCSTYKGSWLKRRITARSYLRTPPRNSLCGLHPVRSVSDDTKEKAAATKVSGHRRHLNSIQDSYSWLNNGSPCASPIILISLNQRRLYFCCCCCINGPCQVECIDFEWSNKRERSIIEIQIKMRAELGIRKRHKLEPERAQDEQAMSA